MKRYERTHHRNESLWRAVNAFQGDKMKERIVFLILTLILLAAVTFTAFAASSDRNAPGDFQDNRMEPGSGMPMQGIGAMKDVMEMISIGQLASTRSFRKQVGISDDQAKKISDISKSDSDAMKRENEKIASLGTSFSNMFKSDAPNAGKLNSMLDQISAVQSMINKKMLHMALSIRATLTEEQLKKASDYIAKQRQERNKDNRRQGGYMGEGRGGFPGGGGPMRGPGGPGGPGGGGF
jgi:hypothetical protein